MFFSVKYDDTTNNIVDTITNMTDNLIDGGVKQDIAKLFAEMCDPYVPYLSGNLAHSATPSIDGVTYYAPYAEEQYERMDSNFTREFHPLATGHWDEVMLQNQGDEFYERVKQIILEKAQEEGFTWR